MATPTVSTVNTNYDWASLLLNDLGAPVTANNVNNILRWMTAENGAQTWSTRWNPLNNSLGTNASNGTGSYPDLITAATETATNIKSGFGGIYSSLLSNSDPVTFSNAVVSSNWSANHYGVASAGSANFVPGRGSNYIATITVPATFGAVNFASGISSQPNRSKTLTQTKPAVGCGSKNGGIKILGATIFNPCQMKAVLGGLLVTAGGVMILFGIGKIISQELIQNQISSLTGNPNKFLPQSLKA